MTTHTESSSIWHRNLYDTMPFLHKEGRALSLSVPTIIRPLDTSHSGLYHGQSNQRTMEAPQYNSVGGWRSATGSEQCGCTCVVCSFYSHLTRGRESTFTTSQGSRGTWPTDWLGAERSLGWKLMAGQGQGQACDREGRPLWTASHSHCGLLWPLLGGTKKGTFPPRNLWMSRLKELSLWTCQDNDILTCIIRVPWYCFFYMKTSVSIATLGFHPFVKRFSGGYFNIHTKRDAHFQAAVCFHQIG